MVETGKFGMAEYGMTSASSTDSARQPGKYFMLERAIGATHLSLSSRGKCGGYLIRKKYFSSGREYKAQVSTLLFSVPRFGLGLPSWESLYVNPQGCKFFFKKKKICTLI